MHDCAWIEVDAQSASREVLEGDVGNIACGLQVAGYKVEAMRDDGKIG